MQDVDAVLTAKLTLEADLARPMAQVMMGYVSAWERTEGQVPLQVRVAFIDAARSTLERHYGRVLAAMYGRIPTSESSIDREALSIAQAEGLYARANERAAYIIGSLDRDLVRLLAVVGTDGAKSAEAFGIETKDDKPKPFTIGLATRFRTTAMQAYFRVRNKLRGIVNAETQEPAEQAMFEWVAKRQGNAPVVKVWVTVGDERVRASHVAAGERYAEGIVVDQVFELAGGRLRFPGDSSLGASLSEIINCFPEGTLVSGRASGATRHWYDGDLVEVVTGGGHKLAGTPNHPVFTARGWVALCELQEGDYVLCRSGAGMNESTAGSAPDVDNMEAPIEKVFDTLSQSGLPMRVDRLAVNFHGDRPAHDVDVVGANGVLWNALDAPRLQHLAKLGLASADLGKRDGLAERLAASLSFGGGFAAPGGIGSSGDLFSLGRRRVGEPDVIGFGAAAYGDAASFERTHDGLASYVETLRKRQNRHAGVMERLDLAEKFERLARATVPPRLALAAQNAGASSMHEDGHGADPECLGNAADAHPAGVEFQRLIDLRLRKGFSGHVLNLSTVDGFYFANGVVASNCRCSLHYYARTPEGLTPIGLSTPSIPARRTWRPGDRFGEEIPVRATELVTLNGKTRAKVVLGDDRTFATLSQPSPSTINVSISGRVVARATHERGEVTSLTIADGREGLGIERLIRDSVAHSWARRGAP